MGNNKLVSVAGLAINVRLSSHMMHAASAPTRSTLAQPCVSQLASSHSYKRERKPWEKTQRAEAESHTRERKIKKECRARRANFSSSGPGGPNSGQTTHA
ncbi:hypothetical protein ACLOJK_003648 [Asimina triloba]